MDWNFIAKIFPYIIGLIIPMGVCVIAFRHRHINGARQYGWYMLARSVWDLGLLMEVLNVTFQGKNFWLTVEAISAPVTLISAISFLLAYSESKPKKFGLVWGLLTLPPTLFLLIAITNSWHGLLFQNPHLDPASSLSLLHVELAPVAWVVLFYTSLVMLIYIGILSGKFIHGQSIYRSQVFIVMVGMLTDIFGIWMALSFNQRNLISPAAALGNLIVAWGLFRFRLFDLRPIARDAFFEKMTDLVIVLDAEDRIVDINPSALTELGLTSSDAIGKNVSILSNTISDWSDLVDAFREPVNKNIEFAFEREEDYFHFDVQASVMTDRHGNYAGRIFIARDVTAGARMHWQLKVLNEELQALNQDLENRVQIRTEELREAYDTTLQGWARALELRDKETEGHSQRVINMTMKLAHALDVPKSQLENIRRGALLHDIGKMAIPDEILRKEGTLTREEREIVSMHPVIAYRLLSPIKFLEKALEIPYCHHEKWDGSGYPRGLKGEEIPFSARIFSVVDVWDAIQSNRIYRKAWPKSKARAYMKKEASGCFDPNIVDVFLDLEQQGKI